MPTNSLEQEAMDRVRKMYASFDRPAPRADTPRRERSAPAVEKKEPPSPPKEPAHPEPRNDPEPPKSLLDVFLKDQDQSLILLLLVMLMKDGADMNLMLALVYLLI